MQRNVQRGSTCWDVRTVGIAGERCTAQSHGRSLLVGGIVSRSGVLGISARGRTKKRRKELLTAAAVDILTIPHEYMK